MPVIHPPTCGTEDTPPCPSATLLYTLQSTIDQLAGPNASEERRATIRAAVEAHLISVMTGVVALDRIADTRDVKYQSSWEAQRELASQSSPGKIGNSDHQRVIK